MDTCRLEIWNEQALIVSTGTSKHDDLSIIEKLSESTQNKLTSVDDFRNHF